NDRPDDQPENENDRSRHEQEAERPPALDLLNSGGAEGGIGHAFGSSLGATARYQPSLTAFSQSPPGKVGMEDGMMSANFSRRAGSTWSQDTPGKPPSSVRTADWISSERTKSASFRARSLLTPLERMVMREKPPGRPRSWSWTRPVVSGSTPWAMADRAWSDQAGIMVTADWPSSCSDWVLPEV